MRLVILPQLIRIALPGLANLWLILLKDTALVSAIGLSDILRQTGVAARVTREAFVFFASPASSTSRWRSSPRSASTRSNGRWSARGRR